jgi:hypothetical protein
LEGADGVLSATELGVDTALPAGLPHRYGYHIGGEPKTQEETDEVIATAAALKAYDPGAFVAVGLNTDATDAMEDQMMSDPNIDAVIGHRYYSNNTSYANLEHTRALGLKHNKPYFRFLRAFRRSPMDAESEDHDLTESDFRFTAFASLAYGYTGFHWFVYNLQARDEIVPLLFVSSETYRWLDRRLPAFDNVAALNCELTNIGEQIKHLTSTDVRLHLGKQSPYSQPKGTSDWSTGAGNDPYITGIDQAQNDHMDILIGFFRHDDTQNLYFMVQNTLHTHNENQQKSTLSGVARVAFDFSSVDDPHFKIKGIQKLNRRTGLWETLILTSDGDDQYFLDLPLSGGTAELLRYSFIGEDDNQQQSSRSSRRLRLSKRFRRTAGNYGISRTMTRRY